MTVTDQFRVLSEWLTACDAIIAMDNRYRKD